MLIATLIFAVFVALWGSPGVVAVVRTLGERIVKDDDPGDPAPTSPARDAAYEGPPASRRAPA